MRFYPSFNFPTRIILSGGFLFLLYTGLISLAAFGGMIYLAKKDREWTEQIQQHHMLQQTFLEEINLDEPNFSGFSTKTKIALFNTWLFKHETKFKLSD